MPTVSVIETGLNGATIERQSRIGDMRGAVLHVLPGGVLNPEGFGSELKDVYAFTAEGKNVMRGGHYHPVLNELFLPMSGTALWILSDFREASPTFQKTVAFIMGLRKSEGLPDLPCYTLDEGSLPRLRVPAGVYHAVIPLTDERVMTIALGSTPYDKEDYRYPTVDEVPSMRTILDSLGIQPA